MNIWNALLVGPLTTTLRFFYDLFGGNVGLAIILLTIILRILLLPLSLPMLRSASKQRDLKPKLDKLKKKYKDDRQKLAQAQMELFRQAGVNPFAGCLPQILQIVILIALYQVFIGFLSNGDLNTRFLIWDLSRPDPYFILPVLAAASQFLLSRMSRAMVSDESVAAKATKEQSDDFATMFQKQNLYIFPLFTLFLGTRLSAGLMLYWFVSSVIQFGQQWWVTGRKKS
jgi:YidC/Oxa1 family membrane protein insertase